MSYDNWKSTEPDDFAEPPRCKCEEPCDCTGPLTPEEMKRLKHLIDAYLRGPRKWK